MKKERLLLISTLFLLFTNIILVSFIILAPKLRPGKGPKAYISQKLDLDEPQKETYEKLIKAHKAAISQEGTALASLKSQLYAQLANPDASLQDSLLSQIAGKTIEIERIHLAHFKDIELLCKPVQKERFKALCLELEKLFAHKPKGPKK